MAELPKRRSRFKRTPTGKGIRLQSRDYEILRLLHRYRYLSSDRLCEFLAPNNPKKLIERLGDLFHETSLIDRPACQWKLSGIGGGPVVYSLTKHGLSGLLEQSTAIGALDPVLPKREDPRGAQRLFEHTLQISEVLSSIELSCRSQPDRRLITEGEILRRLTGSEESSPSLPQLTVNIPPSRFVPHQNKPARLKIVPDALLGIEHGSGADRLYRFYALEVECTDPLRRRTLTNPSYLRKLLTYRALIHSNIARQKLNLPHLTVIFACKDPAKHRAMFELASQIWSDDERRFLLLRPIKDFAYSSSMEITDKWLEHFEA